MLPLLRACALGRSKVTWMQKFLRPSQPHAHEDANGRRSEFLTTPLLDAFTTTRKSRKQKPNHGCKEILLFLL